GIGQRLIREVGILWVLAVTGLSLPAEPDLHQMSIDRPAELLVIAEGAACQVIEFRARRIEQTTNRDQPDTPPEGQSFLRMVRVEHPKECIEPSKIRMVVPKPAFRDPATARRDELRGHTILNVRKCYVVRFIQIR